MIDNMILCWNTQTGSAEDIACPSAKVVYPWDHLGTYHGGPMLPVYGLPTDVAGPSSFPSYSWNTLENYHAGTLLPPYFEDVSGAVEDEDYAYYEDEFSNYSYSTPLVENDSSFNLNVDHYGFPLSVGSSLPRENEASADSMQQRKQVKIVESEIDEKYKAFKQFDTVGDHSDHFYLKYRTVKKVVVCILLMLDALPAFCLPNSVLVCHFNSHRRSG